VTGGRFPQRVKRGSCVVSIYKTPSKGYDAFTVVHYDASGFLAYAVYQAGHVVIPNAYAVWWMADLVIDHMEKHDGAWPRSWDELRVTSEQAGKGTVSTNLDGTVIAEFRPRDTINDLQKRVEIDWNADPRELVKAEFKAKGPPFRVIWLRNGKSTHYQGKEPNEMVLEYLKWRAKNATNSVLEPARRTNPSSADGVQTERGQ
jgi:hypothetical protein